MKMIIMIMLTPPVFAGFTIHIVTTIITMTITPTPTGMTTTHGTGEQVFIWVTTGGDLHFRGGTIPGIWTLTMAGVLEVTTDTDTDTDTVTDTDGTMGMDITATGQDIMTAIGMGTMVITITVTMATLIITDTVDRLGAQAA